MDGKKLPKVEIVHIPQNIKVTDTITASKVIIPDTYINGNVEYEDEEGNSRGINTANHIRFIGKDRRSDVVIGPEIQKG